MAKPAPAPAMNLAKRIQLIEETAAQLAPAVAATKDPKDWMEAINAADQVLVNTQTMTVRGMWSIELYEKSAAEYGKNFVAGILGQRNASPSADRLVTHGRVLRSVRFNSADVNMVRAVVRYTAARGEPIEMQIGVANTAQVEVMQSIVPFGPGQAIRTLQVLPNKGNYIAWNAVLPQKRFIEDFVRPPITAATAPAVPAAKPVANGTPASRSPVASAGALDELKACAADTSFWGKTKRSFCESEVCRKNPDLATQPQCVEIREMEERRKAADASR